MSAFQFFVILKWIIGIVLLMSVVFFGEMKSPLPLKSKVATSSSIYPLPQFNTEWSAYLYATPTGSGRDFIANLKTNNIQDCQDVEFFAEYLGSGDHVVSVVFDAYKISEDFYQGSTGGGFFPADHFFRDIPSGVADLSAICSSLSLSDISTLTVKFINYHVSGNTAGVIFTDDRVAELSLHDNSLYTNQSIIAMPTIGLPEPLPDQVRLLKGPYSFRAPPSVEHSDQNMALHLYYSDEDLGTINPLTIRVLEWQETGWIIHNNHTLHFDGSNYSLSIPTRNFTTYALGAVSIWCDSFLTDIGLESMSNINQVLENDGKLKLDNTFMSGTIVSKPYKPSPLLEQWQSISYMTNVPFSASLTVNILNVDGYTVMTNIASGQDLSLLDPENHPSLKLQLNLKPSADGISPELDEWCIVAKTKDYKVYFPVIAR